MSDGNEPTDEESETPPRVKRVDREQTITQTEKDETVYVTVEYFADEQRSSIIHFSVDESVAEFDAMECGGWVDKDDFQAIHAANAVLSSDRIEFIDTVVPLSRTVADLESVRGW